VVNELTADKLAIRETVENWAVWRDAGDCDIVRARAMSQSKMPI